MPLNGSSGKFLVKDSSRVVHGHFLPLGGPAAKFNPDDSTSFQDLAKQGPIVGSFEQDESPTVGGVFPGNGITGKLSFNNGTFDMTLDKPGRKGSLTPGKVSFIRQRSDIPPAFF
jgi:hypothetical protein